MFSKNNKISKRQMFRLLMYDLLGIGTLLLPSALAKDAGRNGMLTIGIGIGAGLLYCMLLGFLIRFVREDESYPTFLKRCFGTFFGTVVFLFYALYYLCLGGYSAYIFGHLMITELLKDQSFYWIVAGILLLCAYGIMQGIEGRARIYEILFWFLMAPLFALLFLAARDVETPRLFPLYTEDWGGILRGSYYSFSVFSLGSFSLFLAPFAKQKKSIPGACIGAVLFSGVVLFALYGILQGIFGTEAMYVLEYPAVTLMSMIQVPGGFFQRQDALMVAIWFFTVFALLSSSMFYAVENLKELTAGKKEKLWIAVTVVLLFGIAVWSYRSVSFTDQIARVFLLVATPLVVLIPLAAALRMKLGKKGGQAACGLLLFCFIFPLMGCSTQELENRKFPLAMGIDKKEDSCLISYKFQNLSAVADENADSPGGTDFFIEEQDFFTGISKYANNTNKIMDYNHMKALILSEDFAEDAKALSDFLKICGKESLIARNTLLFFAEDAAKILKLDENLDTAIGSYLEEMLDSREDYRLKDAVTLGDLYNEMENKEQLLLVPVLADDGGIPVIRNYYAISGGKTKGEISVSEGVLSYLIQGKLKKLAFTMENETAVSINRIVQKGSFSAGEDASYQCELQLEAVIENETGNEEDVKRQLKELFEKNLNKSQKNLKEAPGIDLTNSFYKLGKGGREQYERYRGKQDDYIKDLQCEFVVDVIILNERG
ncbi:MAG: GerAB/ArcD/ProY family transporter [Eubacterium sp.]|jgi:spore germination protein|nr:GerAB/ArcD/ProY family transporter [Eubacterium sp.]